MALPNQSFRLFGLIRYWNIIQYFHPAKYLLDRDWKTVLTEFIPKFRQATDTLTFQLVLRQLISTIEDGHATLLIPTTHRLTGLALGLVPPFYTQLVGDTLLVTGIYSDSLSQLNGIHKGDRIIGVDGQSVARRVDERSQYTTASNRAAKAQQVAPYLLAGTTPIIRLQVIQQGKLVERPVQRYSYQSFGY